MSGSKHSSSPGLTSCDQLSRSCSCPVLYRYVSIVGRSRVGSTQTGETGSVNSLSSTSYTLTPIWSWHNVWSSMRLVVPVGHWNLRWYPWYQGDRSPQPWNPDRAFFYFYFLFWRELIFSRKKISLCFLLSFFLSLFLSLYTQFGFFWV